MGVGDSLKNAWSKFKERDNYNRTEGNFDDSSEAQDMNMDYENRDYESGGYENSSKSDEKVMRFREKDSYSIRLYKLEGQNWGSIAKKASDDLKSGNSVLINTEAANKDAVIRMADFMAGVAYAVEGKLYRHGSGSWVFGPENCEVGGDIYEDSDPFDGMFN